MRQPSSPEAAEEGNGGAEARIIRISAERMEKGSSVLCGKAALCRFSEYGSPLPAADRGVLCPCRTVHVRLAGMPQEDGRFDRRALSAGYEKAAGSGVTCRDPTFFRGGHLHAKASGANRLTAAHRARFSGLKEKQRIRLAVFRDFRKPLPLSRKGRKGMPRLCPALPGK